MAEAEAEAVTWGRRGGGFNRADVKAVVMGPLGACPIGQRQADATQAKKRKDEAVSEAVQ